MCRTLSELSMGYAEIFIRSYKSNQDIMNKVSKVNDFVVRFANVNGTGSASANDLFAKAVFKMGIPLASKNIFPSNIQGLPTWFEVRVSEKGYLGRREGIDIMVAAPSSTRSTMIVSLRLPATSSPVPMTPTFGVSLSIPSRESEPTTR